VSGDLDGMMTNVEELCDGKDNDCDMQIDESSNCSQDCMTDGCAANLTCDTMLNRCVAPQTVGSSCTSDAQCATGFCAPAAALALDPGVIQSGVCSTSCCSTADCAAGSVCMAPGTGARICVRPELAGRGEGADGADCRSGASCASGVCSGGTCRALCRTDDACTEGNCMVGSALLGAGSQWYCSSGIGRGDAGDFCTVFDPTACKSGLCQDSTCVSACGSTADCPAGTACTYVNTSASSSAARWVTGCVAKATTTGVCCTDADCGEGSCAPTQTGDHWEMRCR
jgi:hypothetical protein